ncbi:hypothetical protein NPIL_631391 [Nephila pilipes]|uniref:Uncharacterized protein n=1 Tax=Nephila pilipes TaxID=299642 RepID=A0A8X6MXR9_NEPPI|nr:hypothetical protein NPIL_631391 [Nephila pilipes]
MRCALVRRWHLRRHYLPPWSGYYGGVHHAARCILLARAGGQNCCCRARLDTPTWFCAAAARTYCRLKSAAVRKTIQFTTNHAHWFGTVLHYQFTTRGNAPWRVLYPYTTAPRCCCAAHAQDHLVMVLCATTCVHYRFVDVAASVRWHARIWLLPVLPRQHCRAARTAPCTRTKNCGTLYAGVLRTRDDRLDGMVCSSGSILRGTSPIRVLRTVLLAGYCCPHLVQRRFKHHYLCFARMRVRAFSVATYGGGLALLPRTPLSGGSASALPAAGLHAGWIFTSRLWINRACCRELNVPAAARCRFYPICLPSSCAAPGWQRVVHLSAQRCLRSSTRTTGGTCLRAQRRAFPKTSHGSLVGSSFYALKTRRTWFALAGFL